MLSRVVEHQGFQVETARDGVEAIARLDADDYNVVLLDLMMPRVDGYGVLEYMRANNPELLACTIVATAVPERDIARDLAYSVYRVHTKPFDMAQLLSDVRHCASRN